MAKAAAPRKRGRPPKVRQEVLAEMRPEQIPEIERLADDYVEARDLRMGLTKREIQAQQTLMDAMKARGLTEYEYDDYLVTIDHKATDRVRVRRKKDDTNGQE